MAVNDVDRLGVERPLVRHDIHAMTLAVVVIALGVVGFVLYALGAILKPFFMAVFLFYLISPGADWLRRRGAPRWVAYLTMVGLLVGLCSVTGFLVYDNLSEFTENLPRYEERIDQWIDGAARRLGLAGEDGRFDWDRYASTAEIQATVTSFLGAAFGTLVDFLALLLAIVFYLLFIVLETSKFPKRVRRAFSEAGAIRAMEVGRNINRGIQKYLVVKTLISLGTGGVSGVVLFLFEVDYWFLWATLTFVLNYIPYVGSLFASIFPALLAFIQFRSPVYGIVITGLLLANQTYWGSYLEPRVLGHQLNISPVVLLLLLALWGWIWGVAGMFLSVPIAVATMIILAEFPSTRPLAILFSEE